MEGAVMGVKRAVGDPSLGLFFDEEPETGSSELESFFAVGGALAQSLPGYLPREGQIAYTREIEHCITQRKHLLAEAPCGVGKGFGYLVPALLDLTARAKDERQPIVVVTANIALQEQLVNKDLPMLRKIFRDQLGRDFSFTMLKGFNNYLCPAQMQTAQLDGSINGLTDERREQAEYIVQWAGRSEKGDRSELPFEPYHDVWRQFAIHAVECPKRHCSLRSQCPAMQAKDRSLYSNVIVTNYHMLAAHVASGGTLLNNEGVLVLDEAHECANVMRDALGGAATAGMLYKLIRQADSVLGFKDHDRKFMETTVREVFGILNQFRKSPSYDAYVKAPVAHEHLDALLPALRKVHGDVQAILEAGAEGGYSKQQLATAARVRGQLGQAYTPLVILFEQPEDYVVSLEETRRKDTMLRAHMLTPAKLLTDALFRSWRSVIATSATLSTNHSFHWIRSELGATANDTADMEVPTPFDFEHQGLLVLPYGFTKDKNTQASLPLDTNSDAYRNMVGQFARRTVEAAGGGTLLLFTSYRNMQLAYETCMGLPMRMLKQGDMPRTELVQRFRDDADSTLLGVSSLWTGIDVSGASLRCLFIDKLPFPMRSDPVASAIMDRDDNWFKNMSLPRATVQLKQGVGRLIRSVSDRGACVLADPRLTYKGYGSGVLASLPKMQRSGLIEDIKPFLDTGMVGDSVPF